MIKSTCNVTFQPENVQNAMDVKADNFGARMTLDIADAEGEISYPIATYTYLIIYKTTMSNCDQAVELFRYRYQLILIIHSQSCKIN